ncbi:MAG: alcohol dehydrogenase catalytic domain-containing protein, partial [Propionibacteriaceae bacterium]|nr:alcohol dehydrogenase catalytic domain-containing protein [Propionibacteriaceae bacterium]
MRAVTTTGPGGVEVLRLSEVPPPQAGPGEVRINVIAAGVNRADLLQRRGLYPPPPGISDIIGLEVAGRIDQVGEGVTAWRPGDEAVAIVAGGGYAEQVVAPAGQCAPPPPGVPLTTAAGVIEVAATVVSNLDEACLAAGETLLV